MFTLVCAARSTYVYLGGSIPVNAAILPNADLPIDPPMPDLEDTTDAGIFDDVYDDREVFRNKKDERGIVVRNKAGLVAQSYTHEEGIDYDEIFAPVTMIEAIRDSPIDLKAFSYSDYVGASLDRKSTTGGCQFLRKRLISWQCKKKTVVANSTTKAEYVAAASCCRHALCIQNQMLDYRFKFINTKIYIDNESIICIVNNLVFHSKTKHLEIRHHFIRDSYEKKLIQVIKIHTDQNVADLLTTSFDLSRFNFLIASIGLLNL
uniref:Putative ribonuclease H-like domain-containing protein n=1 Tax=Tanacetum cinerariifolium TaxID=118510 RepID=A0A6L2LHI1_TANCI|nr:putative ribonuclease H-like domain-containing protein [Tanacetum cinerariifolium]